MNPWRLPSVLALLFPIDFVLQNFHRHVKTYFSDSAAVEKQTGPKNSAEIRPSLSSFHFTRSFIICEIADPFFAMTTIDAVAVAHEIADAYSTGTQLTPFSAREGFDLSAGYAVEAELTRRRVLDGHKVIGRKLAFANDAVWAKLKIDTVAWGAMYEDTVLHADTTTAITPVPFIYSPKLEPEIIFKLKQPIDSEFTNPTAIMQAVEWICLGYEIVDCPYVDWKFQAPDVVAAYGLHAGLVLGEPLFVTEDNAAELGAQLASFTLKLFKDDELIEEGGAVNVLRNPALAVGEFAAALQRSPWAMQLMPGELVSSGALTTPQFIKPGQTWRAEATGLPLPPAILRL